MAKGLEVILARIRDNPANRILIERFLVLVAELDDSTQKIRLLLGLSEAIAAAEPADAMRVAYLVFQNCRNTIDYIAKGYDLKALGVVVTSLKALGRNGKAQVIGAELEKLAESRRNGASESRYQGNEVDLAYRDVEDSQVNEFPSHGGPLSRSGIVDLANLSLSGQKPIAPGNVKIPELGLFGLPDESPDEGDGKGRPRGGRGAEKPAPPPPEPLFDLEVAGEAAPAAKPREPVQSVGANIFAPIGPDAVEEPIDTHYQIPKNKQRADAAKPEGRPASGEAAADGGSQQFGISLDLGSYSQSEPVFDLGDQGGGRGEARPASGGNGAASIPRVAVSRTEEATRITKSAPGGHGTKVAEVPPEARRESRRAEEGAPARREATARAGGHAPPADSRDRRRDGRPPHHQVEDDMTEMVEPPIVDSRSRQYEAARQRAEARASSAHHVHPGPDARYQSAQGDAARGHGLAFSVNDLKSLFELFDLYFKKGLLQEAKDVVLSTLKAEREEEEKEAAARHHHRHSPPTAPASSADAAPEESRTSTNGESQPSAKPSLERLSKDLFWRPLLTFLSGIEASTEEAARGQASDALLKRLRQLSVAGEWGVSETAIKQLAQCVQAAVRRLSQETEADVSACLFWQLGHDATARILDQAQLSSFGSGVWGFYLDHLIEAGLMRRALADIRRTITLEIRLPWAKAAWARLPTIWAKLNLIGFDWREEDGVASLVLKLAAREGLTFSAIQSA